MIVRKGGWVIPMLLLGVQPNIAEACHHYKIWHYRTPQRCSYSYARHRNVKKVEFASDYQSKTKSIRSRNSRIFDISPATRNIVEPQKTEPTVRGLEVPTKTDWEIGIEELRQKMRDRGE